MTEAIAWPCGIVSLKSDSESFGNIIELLNAVDSLGLLLGVHEAAEGSLEVFSAWAVGHTSETPAVPVDLASLRVECGLLASFFLKLLGVHTFQSGILGSLGLLGGPFLPNLGSDRIESLRVGIFAILFADRRKKRD